jgi:hypothetical protein
MYLFLIVCIIKDFCWEKVYHRQVELHCVIYTHHDNNDDSNANKNRNANKKQHDIKVKSLTPNT